MIRKAFLTVLNRVAQIVHVAVDGGWVLVDDVVAVADVAADDAAVDDVVVADDVAAAVVDDVVVDVVAIAAGLGIGFQSDEVVVDFHFLQDYRTLQVAVFILNSNVAPSIWSTINGGQWSVTRRYSFMLRQFCFDRFVRCMAQMYEALSELYRCDFVMIFLDICETSRHQL